MAIMASAPDQACMGLMRSTTVPLLYSTDAAGLSVSDLEAIVEPAASLQYPATCQTLQEVHMSRTSKQAFMAGATLLGCLSAPATLESALERSKNWFGIVNPPHGSRAGSGGNHCGITEEMTIREVMGRSSVAGKNLGVSQSWNAGNIVMNPGTGALALQGVDASVPTFTSQPAFAKCPPQFTGFAVGTGKYPHSILREAGDILTMFEVQASTSQELKCSSACAASVQPELEAVEGITEAAMGRGTTPHELVEVTATALHEKHNSTLNAEQHDFSRKGSPGRSLSHDSASHRNKRRNSVSIDPKKRCKGETDKNTQEDSAKFGETSLESMGIPKPSQRDKENQKPKEYSKQDYIHVRACRGQATDSHSLAERVRREKISKRMNYLQDLVPGCKKVTGKAVMLDEIINYVHSLQRQVEHLSMKLASVSSCNEDMTLERQLLNNREISQTGLSSILSTTSEANAAAFGSMQPAAQQEAEPNLLGGSACGRFDFRSLGGGFDLTAFRRCTTTSPISGLADLPRPMVHSFHNTPAISQSTGRDSEELQSVVERGLKYQTSRLGAFEGLYSQLRTGHMKVEF